MGSREAEVLDDQRQRNDVEGKIVHPKRRFGLGLIRETFAVTQGSTNAFNVLVMKSEKLLEILFALFFQPCYPFT